jgi:hypothetical protein
VKKLIYIFVFFVFASNIYAMDKVKVLLVPFGTQSVNDISFLKQSITEMISSKLEKESDVIVSKDTYINDEEILKYAKIKRFDFVISGKLSVTDKSYELEGSLVSVSQKRRIVFLNKKGIGTGTIFVHVNSFTDKILRVGLNKETETSFVKVKKRDGWKSKELDFVVTSMTLGDFDGDGKSEIIVSSKSDIYIYKKEKNSLKKVNGFDADTSYKVFGVDAIDLNKNGRHEIFVTAINRGENRLNSFVMEWDGKKFVKTLKNQNLHFRIVSLKKEKTVLAQKAGRDGDTYSGRDGVEYDEELFKMVWDKSYKKVPMIVPKGLNLYSFIKGDATNEKKEVTVSFTKKDHIRVIQKDEKELWLSGEPLGGSYKYFKVSSKFDPQTKEKVYFSQRLFIVDIDNDGKNELITVHNKNESSYLPNSRTFSIATIKVLVWGATGFDEKFQSSKLAGYISDFYVGDIDNDGKKEIVYAVVSKSGMFSSKKTVIYTYNLY